MVDLDVLKGGGGGGGGFFFFKIRGGGWAGGGSAHRFFHFDTFQSLHKTWQRADASHPFPWFAYAVGRSSMASPAWLLHLYRRRCSHWNFFTASIPSTDPRRACEIKQPGMTAHTCSQIPKAYENQALLRGTREKIATENFKTLGYGCALTWR